MAVLHEGKTGIFYNAGAPSAGTDCVQTLTLANITGGTFRLTFEGHTTAAITWSATTNTLIANIDAALGALNNIGSASNVTTADSSLSGGNGDLTVTFVAALGKKAVSLLSADVTSLTGTGKAITPVLTTPGVDATVRGCSKGAVVNDTTNGKLYINTGTAAAPTWTVVGAQS